MKVCLIVVFNSPFPRNIPILLDLYRGRFDQIFFLTHQTGGYDNALPVQGHSHYFHNFYLQWLDCLLGYDYYVITHDDAVLHPQLNKHNLWQRFAIPQDAICLRNIDIVPRDSPWSWAWKGGYDIVDANQELKTLLENEHAHLLQRFERDIASFGLSRYGDPVRRIQQQKPMLYGGGANADLLFMNARGFEKLMEKIQLLNHPGLFVEIVVPMAALLTDQPIYLLGASHHAPVHRQSFLLNILLSLFLLLAGDRISFHPIKFGKAQVRTRQLFLKLYHSWQ